ncbi:hypothetical protein [Virgibacillus oceani]|uniref:hypothetical protein n=1 Tax=Virgibacillus oceani TaxID=1479511 RepID=UPI001662C4E4|nr:hypothetical protein [Virgibacillus oceani]
MSFWCGEWEMVQYCGVAVLGSPKFCQYDPICVKYDPNDKKYDPKMENTIRIGGNTSGNASNTIRHSFTGKFARSDTRTCKMLFQEKRWAA